MINPLFLNIYACATQKKDPLLVTGYYLPSYFQTGINGADVDIEYSFYLKEIYKYRYSDTYQGMKVADLSYSFYLKEIYFYRYANDEQSVSVNISYDMYEKENYKRYDYSEFTVAPNLCYLGNILIEQEFVISENNIIDDLSAVATIGYDMYLRDCVLVNNEWKLANP